VRLGSRQLDVLHGAAAGKAATHHVRGGRMVVFGLRDAHPEAVVDRLLDLGLVDLGERTITGYRLDLTEAGRARLDDQQ
jgi:hypothetical protein